MLFSNNSSVPFSIAAVLIVVSSEIVGPFPSLSEASVLTTYSVFASNPSNTLLGCQLLHSSSSIFPFPFSSLPIWYLTVVGSIPLPSSVCFTTTVMSFVVEDAIGAVSVGASISL